MQKRTIRSLPLAALLAASAHAQSSTITSTIPVCPTAASTTITLPTTVTFCPGPHCNGGGPQMTPPPMNGVGMPGVNVGQYTSVGPDGKTTVLGIWETVYDSLCETGLVPATWTITQECPCEATPHPTAIPSGFETTVMPCSVCAHPTITLTQPCPTGPYATQTPSTGQPSNPAAPAAGSAAPAGPAVMASAGATAMASAAAGSGPAASVGANSGSGASAQSGPGAASAQAGSGSGANAMAGPNGASAMAGASASAMAGSSPMAPASSPMSPDGMAVAPAEANGTMPMTPSSNGTRSGSGPAMPSYMSSAGHISIAGFTLFAGAVAALLL